MDNAELLSAWDRGDEITTVEMGGFNEGYEMAIQLCGMEWLRALVNDGSDLSALSEGERRSLRARLEPQVDSAIYMLGLHDRYGMSGAQVGAAMNLASCFYSQGYEAGLQSAGEDRHIKIRKTPFLTPAQAE